MPHHVSLPFIACTRLPSGTEMRFYFEASPNHAEHVRDGVMFDGKAYLWASERRPTTGAAGLLTANGQRWALASTADLSRLAVLWGQRGAVRFEGPTRLEGRDIHPVVPVVFVGS